MQYSENRELVRPDAVEDQEGKPADGCPADILVTDHGWGTPGELPESGEQLVQGDQEPAAEPSLGCLVVRTGGTQVGDRGRREDQIH